VTRRTDLLCVINVEKPRLSRLVLYDLIATSFPLAVRTRVSSAGVELFPVVRRLEPDAAICGRRTAGP